MSETVKTPFDEEPPGAPADEGGERTRASGKKVALDWEGLERALMHPAAGAESYLDTHTGEVVDVIDGWSDDHGLSESDLAEGLVSERLVAIVPLPSETVQGWMSDYAVGLVDGWARDALRLALAGEAPMTSFEEVLGRFPRERLGWLARRATRVAALLRAWLEAKDIEATTQPRPVRIAP